MLAVVGIAVCVGVILAVWVAGALYNALRSPHSASYAPRERTRSHPGSTVLIVVAVACAGLAIVSRSHFDGLAVGALWVRVLGFTVLVASTMFTLWARFSLGLMWSAAPMVKADHQLRTHGPYAVTRHPIRMEEHLMLATFPDEYPRYRHRVPQLVPGLFALRQRHSASSSIAGHRQRA